MSATSPTLISPPKTVILAISNNAHRVKVEQRLVLVAETLQHMIEDCGADGDDTVLPLPGVESAETLDLLVDFMKDYDIYLKTLSPEARKQLVEAKHKGLLGVSWTDKYLKFSHPRLFSLLTAADYLNLEPLVDLACRQIAVEITGKTRQQVLDHFRGT